MTELAIRAPLSKSFDASGAQFAWDSTSIKLVETCGRKYQYKMLEGWAPKGKGVHLRFGGHYASAIEHFYKHRALGMEFDEALEEVVLEALCDTWDRPKCATCDGSGQVDERLGGQPTDTLRVCPDCDGIGYAGPGAPWESLHNLKTRATLIRTIIWYLEQFRDDSAKPVILANGKPAVELSFTFPVDDGIILAGHLDRLAEYADNLYVMDEKTSGATLGPYYFKQFDPDTQMSLYTFAGTHVFNLPVKGVIIDAAQIAVGFSRFERGMTFRTAGQLTEWYDTTLRRIEQARKDTINNELSMNPSSCGNFGGCEFRDICSLDPAVRQRFLKADFDKGPVWDPLERR